MNLLPQVAGLVLIPMLDQSVKLLLRRRLGAGSISLGPFGVVRTVEARIWMARVADHPAPAILGLGWLLAAGAMVAQTAFIPSCDWFVGLLLGGSLSHALESAFRGCVTDYVCLRFWPAFNLADVAITLGAVGFLACALKSIVELMI